MTENPISNGSSSAGRQGSSHALFPKPVSFGGLDTVVNPERRGTGSDSGAAPRSAGSSLWSRLCPNDAAPGEEYGTGAVGCRLGHFLIEGMIGTGGMGAVFRAVDERLDRVVALKILSPSLASRDPAAAHRFLNEARAAARLDHENIARVYFVGEDQGLQFIAHEFVTGRNLRDMIRGFGPLDPREAVNYTLQIATALRHTAAAGVVHRDIKPSNIIVTPRGRAKLVDLGLAKKVASESFGELTIAGTTLGTFDYISPEQAKDPRNVDVRSDIYSLGCTLYHMLVGEPPYPEGTVLQKLLDHQAKGVPDPSRRNPRIPASLSAVVGRMMAPDPRDRYATPDDLILGLLPIAAEMGLRGVNPEGLVWTSRALQDRSFLERNLVWISAGAALVVVVFLLDLFSDKIRPLPAPSHNGAALAIKEGAKPSAEDVQSREPNAGTVRSSPSQPGSGRPGFGQPSSPPPANDAGTSKMAAATGTKTGDPVEQKLVPFEPSDPEKYFKTGTAPSDSTTPTLMPPGSAAKSQPSGSTPSPEGQRAKAATAVAAFPAATAPEISIVENGEAAYATLEAAVADAKDGNTIELKFTGSRTEAEKPFRVSGKRITIRSGKGFRPVISFSPRQLPATGFESRMIAMNNGSIELVDVDIQATVSETTASDHWSLFSIGGSDHLRWRGVNITVTNPGNRPAEVVDISSGRDPLERMPTRLQAPMGASPEFEVDVEHSFIRGGCSLFTVRTTEPGRLDVRQSIVAVQGALLASSGDDESAGDNRRLALRMEHVTAFLGGGLIEMDGGDVPRFLVPLDVTVRNNIFATNSTTPLVSLAGRTNGQDLQRLIRWDATSTRNFYDRFTAFWSVGSSGGAAETPLQFEDWRRLLGDTEIESNNGGIVWKHAWQTKPFAAIRKSDCELGTLIKANSGATDNTDAGADLSVIRPMSEP